MLYTTFALAHKAEACLESYKKMATALGGITKYGINTPIPLTQVLEVCGLQDALWALRCTTDEPAARIFRVTLACDYAWHVLPNYESMYPGDMRVRNCIKVTRKYIIGQATREEFELAAESAESAWSAAESARWAARGTAAESERWTAVWSVRSAWSAAESARWTARWTAESARWTAESVWSSMKSAKTQWQTEHFIELLKAVTDAR